MNNNENQALPPTYLDQIATKPYSTISILSGKKFLIVLALGILALIAFGVMVIASVPNTNTTVQLAAKLNSVKATSDTVNDKLKSSSLRAANSELNLNLKNILRDFTPLLTARKIDITKLDIKYTKLESNTEILARLEDARLNAIYDRTYAREMSTLLTKTVILMNENISKTTDSKMLDFLKNAIADLTPIQEEFGKFNG